jgi:hypothetical protein
MSFAETRYQNHMKWLQVLNLGLVVCLPLHAQRAGMAESAKPRSPEFAAHLEQATNALNKVAADLPGKVAVPVGWDGSIKYYRGISHSADRVTVYGHSYGAPDNVPPTGGLAYNAFYLDREGRLRLIVAHSPEAAPSVTDQILYHDQQPFARVCYCTGDWSYIDYVHYQGALPVISCRLSRDGSIGLVEEIALKDKPQDGGR